MDKIEMGWGNPEFLNSYWNKQEFNINVNTLIKYNEFGLDELKSAIINLHKLVGNVKNIDDYDLIIGNGATQLINAAVYAYNKESYNIHRPYFLRYPNILQNLNNKTLSTDNNVVQIVTWPNNPDNSTPIGYGEEQILDLCYNWPQFVKVKAFNENIMIFSAAKCFGLAGVRVGWAFVKKNVLSQRMSDYIEWSTSGVSVPSQEIITSVINKELQKKHNVFVEAEYVLTRRWNELRTITNLGFEVINDSGMFIWCKGPCPSNVNAIMGSKFGVSNQYFRLNIGCSEETWNKFKEIYGK